MTSDDNGVESPARLKRRVRRVGDLEQRARDCIAATILERELSIEAAAHLCGVTYGTLWRVLRKRDFRISTLDQIVTGLNIPPSKIFRSS